MSATPLRQGVGSPTRSTKPPLDSIVSAEAERPPRLKPPPPFAPSDDDLSKAFDFLDHNSKQTLHPSDLEERLSIFYPNLAPKECRTLIPEPNFTKYSLKALIYKHELGNFDPVREAFRVYDPEHTGYVSTAALRRIFGALGFGAISKEDIAVLVDLADADKDGRISLEDFRNFVNGAPPGAAPREASTAPASESESAGVGS